ncbi:hypothetical protein [Corynebacterium doosanense]|nr:hypothetical protein [Corynebacterium doosanense]
MLVPIPGMSMLKFVVPDPHPPAVDPPPPDAEVRRLAHALIQKALDVACGMRPMVQLDRRRFARPVHVHLAARLRGSDLRGPVAVRSLHLAPGTGGPEGLEVYGTAVCAATTIGYTARLSTDWPGRLLSFRVL